MGHLSLFPGHGPHPPTPQGPGSRLTLLVDCRPTMEQVERIHLELGPEWGPPHIAHMVLRQMLRMRERVDIRDAAGEVWSFQQRTVRGFWSWAG